MRINDGSVLLERGFYDHFDSIFHGFDPASRPARDSTASSRRSDGGRGREYIIPIKIEASSSADGQHSASSSTTPRSLSKVRCVSSTVSPPSAIQIPIVHESNSDTTTRRKCRPLVRPFHDSAKVYRPTTEEAGERNKDQSDDVIVLDSDDFFAKSQRSLRDTLAKHHSDDQVIVIDDEDVSQSSRRKSPKYVEKEATVPSRVSSLEAEQSVKAEGKKRELISVENRPATNCSCPTQAEITPSPSYLVYDYLKPRSKGSRHHIKDATSTSILIPFTHTGLGSEDRHLDYIRGDGNCLFRALSKELYATEDLHAEFRQAVCDLIQSQPNLFRQYVDSGDVADHVTEMRKSGTWATSCEIYAAATSLDRPIYMLAPSPSGGGEEEYHWLLFSPCERGESEGAVGRNGGGPCYLTLCHTNGNHYDRITPAHVSCNCQLPPPQLNAVSMSLDLTADE